MWRSLNVIIEISRNPSCIRYCRHYFCFQIDPSTALINSSLARSASREKRKSKCCFYTYYCRYRQKPYRFIERKQNWPIIIIIIILISKNFAQSYLIGGLTYLCNIGWSRIHRPKMTRPRRQQQLIYYYLCLSICIIVLIERLQKRFPMLAPSQ